MGKKSAARYSSSLLKSSLDKAVPLEARLDESQARHERNVETSFGLRQRLGAGASSAVAQKFRNVGGRRGFSSNLQQTLRRGKARSGIIQRGENAIANQQLRNRVGIARQRINRKGIIEGALGDAVNIHAGVDIARQQASDQVNSAYAGAAGSILGGALSGFNFDKAGSVPVGMDMGTASADFQNMNFNSGGFNFDSVGQGVSGGTLLS